MPLCLMRKCAQPLSQWGDALFESVAVGSLKVFNEFKHYLGVRI